MLSEAGGAPSGIVMAVRRLSAALQPITIAPLADRQDESGVVLAHEIHPCPVPVVAVVPPLDRYRDCVWPEHADALPAWHADATPHETIASGGPEAASLGLGGSVVVRVQHVRHRVDVIEVPIDAADQDPEVRRPAGVFVRGAHEFFVVMNGLRDRSNRCSAAKPIISRR